MREVNAILGKEIFLGRCGENKATCVSFNISDWQRIYGDGTPYVLHQRNGDKQPYPCDIDVNGDTVTWCVTNSDVAVAGRGRVELQYFKDDTLVKSETFTTVTERALGVASETPPEPYESWMETMLHTATDAQESAEAAAESASEASISAQTARAAELNAQTAAFNASKSESNAKASENAAANAASATALDAITVKNNTEITYEYMAAARDYMAEADGSRKAAANSAIEAQAYANSIVGDKEAAAASAASAKASASEAATSKTNAAASAAEAKIAALDAARSAAAEVEEELVERVAEHVAAAERAEELARNSANESVLNQQAAQTHARTASNHADRAIEAANDAMDSADRAEIAAKNAEQAAGGDFATPAYVDSKAAAAESNANQYTDQKIATIPTPDVSGQINAHNADEEAHADIRSMIQNLPTPDVSGQINAHNNDTSAHADIRNAVNNLAQRISNRAYTGDIGKSVVYYRLGTMLMYTSGGNAGSVTFRGRMGYWTSGGMANFNILLANRDGVRASVFAQGNVASAFNNCDIEVYRQEDGSDIIYLKAMGYWCVDLEYVAYQFDISPQFTPVEPTGTLVWSLSNEAKVTVDFAGYLTAKGVPSVDEMNDAISATQQIAHDAASLATSANATAEAASRNADWAYDEAISKASIFYCYADSTELWEIDEQLDNGNIVILNDMDRYVPMVSANYGESYIFRGAVDDTTVISAFVDSDGWTVTESEAGGIPEDHSSTDTTYGKGSGAYYGHVKLSDSVSSTDSSSSGVAASPVAVKTAYDKAVSAQTAANNAASAASTAQSTATAAQTAATNAQTTADSKAPMYTYGTDDLEAGVTPLESGKLHFVYE